MSPSSYSPDADSSFLLPVSERLFMMRWWLQPLNLFQQVSSPSQYTAPTITYTCYRDLVLVNVFYLTRRSLPLNSDYFTWLLDPY